MAVIQISVEAMDENCAGCQCMDLDKLALFSGCESVTVQYICRNIHMCQYIRNRIIRKEEKEKTENGYESHPKE